MEVIYLDDEVVMAETRPEEPVVVKDRLASHDVCFVMQGVEFKSPGKYALRFFANEEFLGERPFYVLEMGGDRQ